VFSIGQNTFREIISHTNIVDGNLCKFTDLDVEFIAVNAFAKVESKLIPERQLVRYEFMEVISSFTL